MVQFKIFIVLLLSAVTFFQVTALPFPTSKGPGGHVSPIPNQSEAIPNQTKAIPNQSEGSLSSSPAPEADPISS
jgi:hypothetical protein